MDAGIAAAVLVPRRVRASVRFLASGHYGAGKVTGEGCPLGDLEPHAVGVAYEADHRNVAEPDRRHGFIPAESDQPVVFEVDVGDLHGEVPEPDRSLRAVLRSGVMDDVEQGRADSPRVDTDVGCAESGGEQFTETDWIAGRPCDADGLHTGVTDRNEPYRHAVGIVEIDRRGDVLAWRW